MNIKQYRTLYTQTRRMRRICQDLIEVGGTVKVINKSDSTARAAGQMTKAHLSIFPAREYVVIDDEVVSLNDAQFQWNYPLRLVS